MQDEGVGDSVSSFDADSCGYLESDFIDLTLIPPPPLVTGPVKVKDHLNFLCALN